MKTIETAIKDTKFDDIKEIRLKYEDELPDFDDLKEIRSECNVVLPEPDIFEKALYNCIDKDSFESDVSAEYVDKLLLLWIFQGGTIENQKKIEELIAVAYGKSQNEKLKAVAFKAYNDESIKKLIDSLGYGEKFSRGGGSICISESEDADEGGASDNTTGSDDTNEKVDWILEKYGDEQNQGNIASLEGEDGSR